MRESKIVKQILKYLNSLSNCKAIKFYVSPYDEAGTPDILCCYEGYQVWIECKIPGKEPTPIQKLRMKQWSKAGATCIVATSLNDVKKCIDRINAQFS